MPPRLDARSASSQTNSKAHPGRAAFVHARQLTGVPLIFRFCKQEEDLGVL